MTMRLVGIDLLLTTQSERIIKTTVHNECEVIKRKRLFNGDMWRTLNYFII